VIRLGLSLSALLLAGVLAYQWADWPPPSPSERDVQAASPDGGGVQDPRDDLLKRLEPLEDHDAYASVIERPLFRPERKPPEPESADEEPAPEPTEPEDLAALDLSAVVITPGLMSAWVRDSKAQELKRVRLGDELAGWAVKDILNDRVVLERQGERNELILRDFSKMPPPVALPPKPTRRPAAQRTPQRPQTTQPPGRRPGFVPGK
jgi:hypothetical protein